MTVREVLRSTSLTLQQAGCSAPRLDAELLLAKVLECDRAWLIAHANNDVPVDVRKAHAALVERRHQREPLAYITGEKEFWSRLFFVTPDVLIPRPETEHLIETIMEYFPDTGKPYHFCDIGTGSGCIAITLACEYPNAHVSATDISEKALRISRRNAGRYGVASRIRFRKGDMFAALNDHDGPFDAIISNPPYVALDEMHALEAELDYEPRDALTDGADGLMFLRHLLKASPVWLGPKGVLVVETGLCGLPQSAVHMDLRQRIRDLSGNVRVG
ncbi:MAG: peptide chain release factor N(5)-glutamine methyltransferase, partial [Mariprofundaceae bacterium]|nr:peptide chain release factor N(5)-glutamine methyltransferase [Mariprofundaceae bacterium]